MYKPVSNRPDFPALERDILAFWDEHNTFKKSVDQNSASSDYVFYDGPPFATGLPHYGHLLAGTIKDIVPRYQTMRGYRVERRFGWDCHGLPIEALAQEALGISGTPEIHATGVAAFNEQCRSMVLRYVEEWRKTVTRMGRWVDFDNDYKTMDLSFMESVWWVFKQLWEKNLVYKSYRIMPYSWKLNTPLSNFEAGNNYKDVQDPAITVRVRLRDGATESWGAAYLLIWTTTPWTLPGNLAICAGPDIDYVAVRDHHEKVVYILAEARLNAYYKEEDTYTVVARFKGEEILGWHYEPIFPWFADQPNAFQVLTDSYVTTADGTGLVHQAPAYGEDDFRICAAAGIGIVDPLDENCAFTDLAPDYTGRFCKDADRDIIRALKDAGNLVHQTTIVHSYPFCDRTDTPLVYRAIDAWYVRVEQARERLAAANAGIKWVPDYVGDKRFGNWLAEAKDWNISRNRFWGSCLPLWINESDPTDIICVGSVAELETLSGIRVTDLHKHILDDITINRNGNTYRRTPEVLDCWFESGSMPYAQHHYPFNPEAKLDSFFPAQFIAEGLDQTRGWFYTLLVLGTLLFDKSPYENVVVNGLVLAEDGKKMSKRLKNYPDPVHVLDTCGADALRLYMIYSPVVRAENLRFSEAGVRQILRDLLIPWWNAYSFFVTYANVDGFHEPEIAPPNSTNELDRWVVSSLETLIDDVTTAMDGYDLQRSVRPFVQFVENLTNWYIRRSRRRFWKSQNDADKLDAYRTLRYVLVQLCKVAAPFTPFIAEEIYCNLRGNSMPESVHLCSFPTANATARDEALERRMALAQTAVNLGHYLRKQRDLKVRQPLATATVVSADQTLLDDLRPMAHIIAEELNVKEVAFAADEQPFVTLSAKANFKTLGKRLGKRMKAAADAITALNAATLTALANGTTYQLDLGDDSPIALNAEDILIQRDERPGMTVANEGSLTLALETTLNQALITEGLAREFVSTIQGMRKEADLDVSDRITLNVSGDASLQSALETHADYICGETLCTSLRWDATTTGITTEVNGHNCTIALAKSPTP
ncbi:MAG: isoleucine--tRNA ligase [Lentisphaerae bacterium]|jgi:isoleucyl-tRNA synthetase|nr:isoleucine--tRNA ligase [Lentisphaerota bacterium]